MRSTVFYMMLFLVGQLYARPNYSLEHVVSYTPNYYRGEAVLKMAYASSIIQNPQVWKSRNNSKVLSVSIIFSDYPKRKADWLTHYDTLLNRRVRALKMLIPKIDSMKHVKWKIILQTACQNEAEAKELFHGIILKYKARVPKAVLSNYKIIKKIISGNMRLEDSTVFNVLQRNKWRNMLVINDWTSSMYTYGAQVVLWYRVNNLDKRIKSFVFFNDGNQKQNLDKRIGKTGGLWWIRADNIKTILRTIRTTMLNGNGGDIPENDFEAILYGLKHDRTSGTNVVLIADNNSPIRDRILIADLTIPVKIIVCGKGNKPIHPHYLDLAFKTKGSIHTIEEDIIDLTNLQPGERIKIGKFEYQFIEGNLKLK